MTYRNVCGELLQELQPFQEFLGDWFEREGGPQLSDKLHGVVTDMGKPTKELHKLVGRTKHSPGRIPVPAAHNLANQFGEHTRRLEVFSQWAGTRNIPDLRQLSHALLNPENQNEIDTLARGLYYRPELSLKTEYKSISKATQFLVTQLNGLYAINRNHVRAEGPLPRLHRICGTLSQHLHAVTWDRQQIQDTPLPHMVNDLTRTLAAVKPAAWNLVTKRLDKVHHVGYASRYLHALQQRSSDFSPEAQFGWIERRAASRPDWG